MKNSKGRTVGIINPAALRWGFKCKEKGHVNSQGRCLKHSSHGCIQCLFGEHKSMEEWLLHFEELYAQPRQLVKDLPEEEKKKRRSEAAMRWAKRNPDKLKSYVSKYVKKEDVKQRAKDKYAALPWETKHANYLKAQERKKERAAKEQHETTTQNTQDLST